MQKPKPHKGLHHVALFIKNFAACEHFYTEILGLKIIWRPDADNLYLTSGNDNLALHKASENFQANTQQRLDHFGFFLEAREDVDAWYEYMLAQQVEIKAKPKDHRDGTRSFYCADPDGNVMQMIFMGQV
jgi:catechol 2,3-dioxygenase-like lactoylglutathione lyase family enzyme